MGIMFYGSQSSRFFLGLEGRDAFLMRESREIWRRKIPFNVFQVAGVGNRGRVVISAEEGVFDFPLDPNARITEIPIFGNQVLKKENAVIARVVLDQGGDKLMVEKVSKKSKLADRIFKIISPAPRVHKGQIIHDLLLYEIDSQKKTLVYRSSVDHTLPHAFFWGVSPSFSYCMWAEGRKRFKDFESKFSIVDLVRDQIFDEFSLEGLAEWQLMVNNYGSILIDSPKTSETREILIAAAGGQKTKVNIHRQFMVNHLGKDFISFRSRMGPLYVFKGYDDRLIEEIDLSAVEEMELEYSVIFNQNDDIDFMARKSGQIKHVHTSWDRFSTDARRWRMMVDQKRIDEEIAFRKGDLEKRQSALKEQQSQLRAKELLKSVMDEKSERSRQDMDIIQQKEKQLAELRDRYNASLIGRYEYLLAERELEGEILELKLNAGISVDALSREAATGKMPAYLELSAEDTRFMPENEKPQEHMETVFIQSFSDTPRIQPPAPPPPPPKIRQREPAMPEPREEIAGSAMKIPASELQLSDEDLMGGYRRSIYAAEKSESIRMSPPPSELMRFEEEEQDTDDLEPGGKRRTPELSGAPISMNTDRVRRMAPPPKTKSPVGGIPLDELDGREDTTKLLQIRQQIEREIQEAVDRKKQTGDKIDKVKAKYVKLLTELEESYHMGIISKENYLKMRQRYEERLRKVEDEFNRL